MRKRGLGIFPGTFDPVTFGHIDLIQRAVSVFEQVIVAVAHQSSEKKTLFTVEERKALLREVTKDLPTVTVEDFGGLVVDYVKGKQAGAMIRGLRMLSDFEYEFQMALMNRRLADEIETIFLMPHESYAYVSSRLVKEVAALSGDIGQFVPPAVAEAVQKKLAKK